LHRKTVYRKANQNEFGKLLKTTFDVRTRNLFIFANLGIFSNLDQIFVAK
jgi:hypothetical protein